MANSSIKSSTEEGVADQTESSADWKINFEKELKESYKVTVKRYEDFGDGLYGVYVNEIETGELPYVTVDSKTGNFHG